MPSCGPLGGAQAGAYRPGLLDCEVQDAETETGASVGVVEQAR